MFSRKQEFRVIYLYSGGSRGGARGARATPLFWVKKEEMTDGRKVGRASKTTFPSPPLLAQSLDPQLLYEENNSIN